MLNNTQIKIAASALNALSNKNRLKVVAYLLDHKEANVKMINKMVIVSQPALSQHLGALRKAGILQVRRESRLMFYSITEPNRMMISRVIELSLFIGSPKSAIAQAA